MSLPIAFHHAYSSSFTVAAVAFMVYGLVCGGQRVGYRDEGVGVHQAGAVVVRAPRHVPSGIRFLRILGDI